MNRKEINLAIINDKKNPPFQCFYCNNDILCEQHFTCINCKNDVCHKCVITTSIDPQGKDEHFCKQCQETQDNKCNNYETQHLQTQNQEHSFKKAKQNIEFEISSYSSVKTNTNKPQDPTLKTKFKSTKKENGTKNKDFKNILQKSHIKKSNLSEIIQETNISYTINQTSEKENSLKYNTLYKDITNQLDIMQYCNKLHKNALDSLSTYLEIYDKYLNEQILMNKSNEEYLNQVPLNNNLNFMTNMQQGIPIPMLNSIQQHQPMISSQYLSPSQLILNNEKYKYNRTNP